MSVPNTKRRHWAEAGAIAHFRLCLRSHLVGEGMCRAAVGGEGDGAKLDVEPLVVDDLVGGLVLGLGWRRCWRWNHM